MAGNEIPGNKTVAPFVDDVLLEHYVLGRYFILSRSDGPLVIAEIELAFAEMHETPPMKDCAEVFRSGIKDSGFKISFTLRLSFSNICIHRILPLGHGRLGEEQRRPRGLLQRRVDLHLEQGARGPSWMEGENRFSPKFRKVIFVCFCRKIANLQNSREILWITCTALK